MDKAQISNFYETDSIKYDARWRKRGGRQTDEAQKNIVCEFTRDWHDKSILEIGCGTGRFSVHIAPKGAPTVLLDLTTGMLKVSRDKLSQLAIPFVGTSGSVYQLPFASETFDAAYSINVFNHLEQQIDALQEINRVLKPGGRFIVNFANLYSYFFPVALYINNRHKSVGRNVYSTWITANTMQTMLFKAGFTIVRMVGNVYVPRYLDSPIIREIPLLLDKISRKSPLKKFSPSLFFLCEKMQTHPNR